MKNIFVILGFLAMSIPAFGDINVNIPLPPVGQLKENCDKYVDDFVKEIEETGFLFVTQEEVPNKEDYDKITALVAPDNSVLIMIMSKDQCAVDSYFIKGK